MLFILLQYTTIKIHEHKRMERRNGSMIQKRMAIKVELQMLAYLWDLVKLSGKVQRKLSDRLKRIG